MKKLIALALVLTLGVALLPQIAPVAAQDGEAPSVTVSDQNVLDGTVTVERVFSAGPGWMVIHADNDGAPGPVIGFQHLHPGQNNGVIVSIDTSAATPVLYAMLHEDTGEMGVYEFGTVEGADGPVRVDGNVVTPPFNVAVIDAKPQFVDGSFTTDVAVIDVDGWLVVHAEADGRPGPVLGFAPLTAGLNTDVVVELEGDITNNLWPMLHVDTGEAGAYEFGTVEGADGPVRRGEAVTTGPVPTVPSIIAGPQVIVPSDNRPMSDDMMTDDAMMGPTLYARGVLSAGPGWLVIHADGGDAPGPVIGFSPLADGYNADVEVALAGDGLTPVLYPMLHTDTGEAGVYEFGTVEGADGPVRVDGNVVVFAVDAAPAFRAQAQPIVDGTIVIETVLADSTGWMVIHASVDGAPGPVIGFTQVNTGLNRNVVVQIEDPASVDGAVADQVFPMLHFDTGVLGAYEFGAVEGADGPVRVNDAVVVGPLAITAE